MQESKTCSKCKQTKLLDYFHKDKSRQDGLRFCCKVCTNASNKTYDQANKESLAATQKIYRLGNREKIAVRAKAYRSANKEKIAARAKVYPAANQKSIMARSKSYYQVNRKAVLERSALTTKAWVRANPEKVALKNQKRRARRLSNGIFTITSQEIANLYGSACAYCGLPSKHIDHVIPLFRGGTHSIGNLVGACASCNLSKGSKLITEWKKDRGW